MANTLPNPTSGFQEFGRMPGDSPNYALTQVWIASTDPGLFFRGDAVISSSQGGANNSGNYITAAASGNSQIRGVFMGCEFFQPTVGRVIWSNFWPGTVTGSTGDVRAYIVDDPNTSWIAFGSTTQTILSSMVGLNIGFTANSSTGNQTSGLSNVALQSTTTGSTQTLPFRIVDFYSNYAPPGINGVDNTTASNIVVLRGNNWDRLSLTARSS